MEAVRFDNVKYSYREDGENYAVNGVTLSIEEGEFVAVLGRNGSGKSTLAKMINVLLTPTEGRVQVFGMDTADDKLVYSIRRNTGMVFQNPAVGMQSFRTATSSRLSGGQKQRIAIAGVLALLPKIMILDESTAMLDPRGRREVMEIVRRLNKEQGMTVILITHFMDEALLADRAVVMHRGEVVMDGAPKEIFARSEELETYNLTLPGAAYICKKLRAAGMPVGEAFTAEELAEEICRSLQRA